MATLRFSPGQVGSTNNINQTGNQAEIDIFKTFEDVTINDGIAFIEAKVSDSELVVKESNDQSLTGASEPLPTDTPNTGETNFPEKTQGDTNTTFTSFRVVMNDGTIYGIKGGSPVDLREQDTSNPSDSFTPEHGDTHVECNGSINLVDADGNEDTDGGAGDDTILAGGGVDAVDGGAGNDNISITGGEGAETTGDTLYLGPDYSPTDLTFTNIDDTAGGVSGNFTMSDDTVVNFSEIENIICFTPGTRILTAHGERRIEALRAGDKVVTRDHGLRPIRWIGSRTLPGQGQFAPVQVGVNALEGACEGLLVSPHHRLLFTGYRAELLFGESEVLVPAKHLVDGREVVQREVDEVTYIHLMLDRHELIYAEGIATESFHAGDVGLDAMDEAAREELFAIFPELRSAPYRHGKTARTCLKAHEAITLKGEIF